MSEPAFHAFTSSAELAIGLAERTANQLRQGVQENGQATLVVSGGTTPLKFFSRLSNAELEWSRVQVLLADERWVAADLDRSNALLVRQNLLQDRAASAQFAPVFSEQETPAQAADALAVRLSASGSPFDAVILGMGADGHTASLFPDAPEITRAVGQDAAAALVMSPPSQPETRITLTPRVLTNTRFLALHIEGSAKRRVFEAAMAEGPLEEMPVRAIIRNDIQPLQVYWCP